MAEISLLILRVARHVGLAASDKTPKSSQVCYLPAWVRAFEQLGLSIVEPDSCAFGCIHKKPFCLKYTGYDLTPINKRCPGFHAHVKI